MQVRKDYLNAFTSTGSRKSQLLPLIIKCNFVAFTVLPSIFASLWLCHIPELSL